MTRKTGYSKGLRAETLAAWYLRFKGYRILAMRYKTRVGEIDLIARRGRSLVFAEVKWRPDRRTAMEAVHSDNQALHWFRDEVRCAGFRTPLLAPAYQKRILTRKKSQRRQIQRRRRCTFAKYQI